MLPDAVLEQAQKELLNWQNLGVSVMEIGHHTEPFLELLKTAEQDLRELLSIPNNYTVLFSTGPTRAHFSMLPLNFLGNHTSAGYINTGVWSDLAAKEASRYCTVRNISEDKITNTEDLAYIHYTDNETIDGIALHTPPQIDSSDTPLIVDMTSSILSRTLDINQYGVIYAGVQKNIAPAGLVILIIRNDLFNQASKYTPDVFNYTQLKKAKSVYYTLPTFLCYMAGLMFKWVKAQGGVVEMEKRARRKSSKLYDFIDSSDFYANNIAKEKRSMMNIPFLLNNPELDQKFLTQAAEAGLFSLKGHRLVGGMRASIYNAMPEEGVDALIKFMDQFQKINGA